MRIGGRSNTRTWARTALKWGLVLSDAELWTAITDDLRGFTATVSDRIRRRYEPRPDLPVRTYGQRPGEWVTRAMSFAGGLGVGIVVGTFMPSISGRTQSTPRERATGWKTRAIDHVDEPRTTGPGAITGTDGS